MKRFFVAAVTVWATASLAQPTQVIAQTSWLEGPQITLLRESCGWSTPAWRAFKASDSGRITWACWGYTEAGVILQWQTGQSELVRTHRFFDFAQHPPRSLGYHALHQRITQP